MTENDIDIKIANIVASGELGHKADLEELDKSLENSTYEPGKKGGNGLKLRENEDDPLFTLFSSGKYIIVGAKDFDELEQVHEEAIEKIRSLDGGEEIIEGRPEERLSIENVVGTHETGKELNLHTLATSIGVERALYEPEQFSALVCEISEDCECTVLAFSTGNTVILGSEEIDEMKSAVQILLDEIEKVEEMAEWF